MTVASPPLARERSSLRAVALPSEHGGWGLTLEPGLLGLLVAPGVAGLCLALAAVLAFVARTPVKLVLVDTRRHRWLERTRLALVVAVAELATIVVLATVAVVTSEAPFWWPLLGALPLFAIELYYDARSRGRRLVPELAGAFGVSGVAAMIALTGGESSRIAAGLWLILAARAAAAIPFVRAQIMAIHGRPSPRWAVPAGTAAALVIAAAAVVVDRAFVAGFAAVVALVVVQHLSTFRPPARAAIVGIRQTVFGVVVVIVTALGVLAS